MGDREPDVKALSYLLADVETAKTMTDNAGVRVVLGDIAAALQYLVDSQPLIRLAIGAALDPEVKWTPDPAHVAVLEELVEVIFADYGVEHRDVSGYFAYKCIGPGLGAPPLPRLR